ncbi:MAG: tetratricopeptide repeat protein [Planctomycetota bacterium]
MRTATWAATVLLSLATVASADDQQAGLASAVELRLKDGRTVVGEIAAFSGGVYTIRTGAELVRVPERDIRTIAPAPSQVVEDETVVSTPAQEQWIEPEDRTPEAVQAHADGLAALDAGQPEAARPLLERAKQLDPWSLDARLGFARACEACGDADEAERELRQVLAVDPGSARALSALKGLFERTGQRSKLDLLLLDMLRARCTEPEAEYRSARHFLASGNLDRACAHWNRYLAIRPSPPPPWDVEARMMAEAEAFAASGQGARAIERCYDLMQHNPLERERALARVIEVQDSSVARLLASRDVARACEELDAMARMAPARAQSFHERSATACSEELARRLAEGDATGLEGFLDWLAQRYAAADAGGLLAAAIEAIPAEASVDGLAAVHRFLAQRAEPEWDATRERLIQAFVARVDGDSAGAVAAAEALEALDTDRADEWRSRCAEVSRRLGLAAFSEGDYPIAVSHLRTAQALLPEDEEIAAAIQEAEFGKLQQRLSGPCGPSEKESLLQAFVEGTTSEAHAAWGREEIEKLRTVAEVEVVSTRRVRERYFPLDLGMRWVYAWSDGREDVMRVDAVEDQGSRSKVEVAVESRSGADDGYRPVTLFVGAQEVWQEREGKRDVWFVLPIAAGRSWESSSGRLKLRRTYQSTNETVDTRMGTFRNCLKVLYESVDPSGGTMTSELFYAPDVGLVKMTTPGGPGMEIVDFQADAGSVPSAGPGGEEGE